MKTSTKILLIVSAGLIALGMLIFAGGIFVMGFDFSSFSTARIETATHTVEENFNKISIKTDTADVSLQPATDGVCRVVCNENVKLKHSVRVEGGALLIDTVDTRKWYDYISFGTVKTDVTVYLPKSEYDSLTVSADTGDVSLPDSFLFNTEEITVSTGDVSCNASAKGLLKIKTSTGMIDMNGVSVGSVDLSVTTGKVTVKALSCDDSFNLKVSTGKAVISNVTCKSFSSEGDTGDITLKNVLGKERLFVKRSTGHVELDHCDSSEIDVTTDTGNVKGTLISEKIFSVKTSTGKVNVPESVSGGICRIKTSTGDVDIDVVQ